MAFTSVIKGLHTNSLYGLNLFLSRWAWKRSDWWSRNWERSCRVSAETADLLKTGGLQLHRVEWGWGGGGGGGQGQRVGRDISANKPRSSRAPFRSSFSAESTAPQSFPTRADLTFESQLPLFGHKTQWNVKPEHESKGSRWGGRPFL